VIAHEAFRNSIDLQWVSKSLFILVSSKHTQDEIQQAQQFQRILDPISQTHLYKALKGQIGVPEPNSRANVDSVL
jgi:hypothetical protein